LPIVGGYADPSIEAILALAPTFVLGARGPAGPALAETLEAHGIATYFPETENLDQIEDMISEVGRRLGEATSARRLISEIEARRRAVAAAATGTHKVRAVLVFGVAPIVAAGPGSFADNLLAEAGAENVITAGGAYPTVDIELLLAKDPDSRRILTLCLMAHRTTTDRLLTRELWATATHPAGASCGQSAPERFGCYLVLRCFVQAHASARD
jgi:iron complex transport system substrate-binding protein